MHGGVIAVGISVHLVLLYAIFDIYYTSPLVAGTRPHLITNGDAPARRLVLITADGLRSESLFVTDTHRMPFIRDQLIGTGTAAWGVSRSHVPTESRPGHVALIAGFYEDVSAVARGWKVNPVPFDSLFNRSRTTWSWGDPDIVLMFSRGIDDGHMHAFTYDILTDFASDDASRLDAWVFEHVKMFFENALHNATLMQELNQDRIVFFLHLLGLDTNGHGYKPNSARYNANMQLVDDGIRNLTRIFADFYGDDNRTAFVFTSDHGMTNWGSHGAGSDHEIMTPLVAWGAGVRPTMIRHDINQVDLAAYMSALIGVPIPMNSVGTLPIDLLDANAKYRFQAVCANLKQVIEQFVIKRNAKYDRSLAFLFREFASFTPQKRQSVEREVLRLAEMKRFEAAADVCIEWIPVVIRGLTYFHRYERTFLGAAIALTFIAWLLFVSTFINRRSDDDIQLIFWPNRIISICVVTIALALAWQHLPASNYIYCLLPVYLSTVAYRMGTITSVRSYICCLPAIYLFVLSFTDRWLISIELVLVGIAPHLLEDDSKSRQLRLVWTLNAGALAIFPLLPTVGQTPVTWLAIAAPAIVALLLLIGVSTIRNREYMHYMPYRIAIVWLIVCSVIIGVVTIAVDSGAGSPLICRMLAWCSLVAAPLLAICTESTSAEVRLVHWTLALFIPYSLLSISYESIFFALFSIQLYLYLRMELSSTVSLLSTDIRLLATNGSNSTSNSTEWRRALMLVLFTLVAFFGTGNVASLNSFNPSFLRAFITVFSPETMAALLVFKIIVPLVSVAIAFVVLASIDGCRIDRLSAHVLIICDTMALGFFFQLKDDGSWLDIGISISHYVIGMVTAVVLFVLMQLVAIIVPIRLTLRQIDKRHAV